MNLIKLAERVEAATGPDRELDAEICRAAGWEVVRDRHDGKDYYEPVAGYSWQPVPAYTSSLDAAMQLVPEDRPKWAVTGRNSATVGMNGGEVGHIEWVFAATPALALCAAALRARGL